MARCRWVALLALAAGLAAALVPASASGAAYVLTDDENAQKPDIVVDRAGTAHVVWATGEGLTYCQVPRDAKSCAATRPLALEHPLFGPNGPSINLMPSGEILITWEGHLASDPSWEVQVRVYALSSSDGGATFAGPRAIADPPSIWGYNQFGVAGLAEVGPGGSSISFVGVGGGANTPLRYSAVPTTSSLPFADEGTDLTPAASLTGWDRGYTASIAFVDPSTPIVASLSLGPGGRIHFRRWSGSGNVNDASSWLPEGSLPGDEPQLAGGPRGAYLIYELPGSQEFGVARYDASANAFGQPAMVSADDGEGAFSGRLVQDDGGTLHAVITEFVDKDQLLYRSSRDGQDWGPIVPLVADISKLPGGGDFAGDDFWDIRADAAPDGDGGVVYTTNQSAGPVLLSPFGAPVISVLSLSRSRFRVGSGSTPVRAAQRRRRAALVGTRVRYRVSENTRMVFVIQRRLAGRRARVGGRLRCVKPTPKLIRRRARTCTRLVGVGRLRRNGRAGQNGFPFSGRIGSRPLPVGSYQIVARATDRAGSRSRVVKRGFLIIPRP